MMEWRCDERAERKKAEALVRSFSCTKKVTGSVSGEGERSPPTLKRMGALPNGEMSWSAGKRERGVGEEMWQLGEDGLASSWGDSLVDDPRVRGRPLPGAAERAMDESALMASPSHSSPASVDVEELR